MQSIRNEIKSIIKKLQHEIPIPNHIEDQAALNGEDEYILSVFDLAHADELFSQNALSLDHLRHAKSVKDISAIIDNYLIIINFYQEHYNQFSHIIGLPFFQDILKKKGDLNCWNELMQHPYKKLTSTQSTTMIIDTLTRLQPLFKIPQPKQTPREQHTTAKISTNMITDDAQHHATNDHAVEDHLKPRR